MQFPPRMPPSDNSEVQTPQRFCLIAEVVPWSPACRSSWFETGLPKGNHWVVHQHITYPELQLTTSKIPTAPVQSPEPTLHSLEFEYFSVFISIWDKLLEIQNSVKELQPSRLTLYLSSSFIHKLLLPGWIWHKMCWSRDFSLLPLFTYRLFTLKHLAGVELWIATSAPALSGMWTCQWGRNSKSRNEELAGI